jgi:exosortase family protein XrtM
VDSARTGTGPGEPAPHLTIDAWLAGTSVRHEPGPLRFLLLFASGYALLYWAYWQVPDAVLRDSLYPIAILGPCAALVNLLFPAEAVTVASGMLQSPRASLEVVRGCDGSGMLFLIVAAIMAFPSAWRARMAGLCGALLLVHALNTARIMLLYFAAAYRESWFLPLHTYLVPTLFVLGGGLYFAWWAARQQRPAAGA